MIRSFTLLLLLAISKAGFTQSIERKLVGSNGTTLVSSGFQLSYSIGEAVIYPTKLPAIAQPFFITAGFQQPQVAKYGQVMAPQNWVSVYPNPTVDLVRLDIHGPTFQSNDVKVFNAAGQKVIAPFSFINGSVEIDLRGLAASIYIIAVTDKGTGHTVSARIIKQNN